MINAPFSVVRRFMFRSQFVAILVTLVAIALIDFTLALLSEISYSLNDTYTASIATQYIALTSPTRLYEYSPYIILVGVLFATGQLANDRALVVLEAAGMTKHQMIRRILAAPLVWLVLFFMMGETIAPAMELKAKETRDLAASQDSTQYGLWHKEGNRFFFFSAVDQHGNVQGGFYLEPNEQRTALTRTEFERIYPVQPGLWQIEHLTTTTSQNTGTVVEQLDSLAWPTPLTPELLLLNTNSSLNLSIQKLHQYQEYLAEQGLNNLNYALKFWQKVLQPLLSLILVWLGITFIFGPLRQTSMGGRIFTGILVALVFNIVQQVLSPLSLSLNLAPVLIASVPLVLAFLLALLLQKRAL